MDEDGRNCKNRDRPDSSGAYSFVEEKYDNKKNWKTMAKSFKIMCMMSWNFKMKYIPCYKVQIRFPQRRDIWARIWGINRGSLGKEEMSGESVTRQKSMWNRPWCRRQLTPWHAVTGSSVGLEWGWVKMTGGRYPGLIAIHQSFSHLLISSMNIHWALTRLFFRCWN